MLYHREATATILVALALFAFAALVSAWYAQRSTADEGLPQTPDYVDESGVHRPILPDPSTLPEPRDFGLYRLYAWGYPTDHDLSKATSQAPKDAGQDHRPTTFDTLDEARSLEGFWSPDYVPPGYELTTISGVRRDNQLIGIQFDYFGPRGQLTVISRQPSSFPIRVDLPHEESALTTEQLMVAGKFAVLTRPKEGLPLPGPNILQFVSGEREIIVRGMGTPIDEVTRVADSIASPQPAPESEQ
jgi:hypothetical protein